MSHCTTGEQLGIATALTWVDFVGSLAAGIADMILRQTFMEGYQVPPVLAQFLIYGLPAIVALNVAGGLLFLANDSELQIENAKKKLTFEITRQAIKELAANKGQIADGMKGDIFKRMAGDVVSKLFEDETQAPQITELEEPEPNPTKRKRSQ